MEERDDGVAQVHDVYVRLLVPAHALRIAEASGGQGVRGGLQGNGGRQPAHPPNLQGRFSFQYIASKLAASRFVILFRAKKAPALKVNLLVCY